MSFRPVDMGKVNPEFEKALQSRSGNEQPVTNVVEFRKIVENEMRDSQCASEPFCGFFEEIKISMPDGHQNSVEVFRPPISTGEEPLIVWYHGGGFCLGDAKYDEAFCRKLCLDLNAVVIGVNYRLAPEFPFPVPINDCWDTLQWISSHSQQLKANLKNGFILSGSSAGGNISAVLSLLARDSKSVDITGVYIGVPIVVHPSVVPQRYQSLYRSYEENKNAPLLSTETFELLIDAYSPDPLNPLYSPLLWPNGHRNLPRSYFQVCGLDPLRDDGIIYERVLREENGISTRIDMYPGVPHAFTGAFPELEISKRFEHDMFSGFRWLLSI
ncbi:hypothetical protein BP5796_12192 [Coleophoma crateriformis]|uniref:Alpha/beta hydrolase fold-3 domain-containing protein n=1 Tax=Coleophoma crateriformis TaxID=565419 RepID=A0A3D8QCD8_9HELO|nr:hypothetical protein BP5796_12192 [Coleophoma crateriformis]